MKENKRIITCSLNGKICSVENPACKYTGTGYGCLYAQYASEQDIGEARKPLILPKNQTPTNPTN
jgi:hypothetical protein